MAMGDRGEEGGGRRSDVGGRAELTTHVIAFRVKGPYYQCGLMSNI